MRELFKITSIWKHLRRGEEQPKSFTIGSCVSFAEINRFRSDMNFRQYYQTERPERFGLLNDITRIKSEIFCYSQYRVIK